MKPRKRAVWRGIVAGIVTKLGCSAVLVLVMVFAGRIWAVRTGTSNALATGSVDPSSDFWWLFQAVNIGSSLLGGMAAARWSPERSRITPIVLVSLALLAAFMAPRPEALSLGQLALWAFGAPVGIILGTLLDWRYDEKHRLHSMSRTPDLTPRSTISRPLRFLRAGVVLMNLLVVTIALSGLFPRQEFVPDRHHIFLLAFSCLNLVTVVFAVRFRSVTWLAITVNGLLAMVVGLVLVVVGNLSESQYRGSLAIELDVALNLFAIAALRISRRRPALPKMPSVRDTIDGSVVSLSVPSKDSSH